MYLDNGYHKLLPLRSIQASYLLSSMRMVSIVKSRFHCDRQGSFPGSTLYAISILQTSTREHESYLPIPLIDAGQVDFRDKGDLRWYVGILLAAVYL